MSANEGTSLLNLRRIKSFLHTARHSSVSRAAEELNRSQSAVSRSIRELENELGVPLFDRSVNGVTLTVFGKAMFERGEYVERVFVQAREAMLATETGGRQVRENSPVFRMDISGRRLAGFIALAEQQNFTRAAARLGTTTAAIRITIREMETALGIPLFDKGPWGMMPTAHGRTLYKYARLAGNELRRATDDIASLSGVKQGRVCVGTMAFSQTRILPIAINTLLAEHPNIRLSTVEGPYDSLITSLLCGDLDFLLGALRAPEPEEGLKQEVLLEDNLSLIVRIGHPLLSQERIRAGDLQDYGWVLPPVDAPARQLFEEACKTMPLSLPVDIVETRSHSITRGLLMESDRISVLSRHQIYYEEQFNLMRILPLELEGTTRPIGVTSRAQTTLSPSAALLLKHIRGVIDHLRL